MMLSFGARGSRSRFLDETWALGEADFLNHFTDLSGGALLTRAHPAVRLLAVRAGAEPFVDIARFGQKNFDRIHRFRPLRDGTSNMITSATSSRRFDAENSSAVSPLGRHERPLLQGAFIIESKRHTGRPEQRRLAMRPPSSSMPARESGDDQVNAGQRSGST